MSEAKKKKTTMSDIANKILDNKLLYVKTKES
jgi:hypothetical protein